MASTASLSPHKRSHLFIELEEYSGRKWQETGRWNHALEEDRLGNDGTQSWSRPHLPTISFHALIHLRVALSATNVMLDVPGNTFSSVVDVVLTGLVAAGDLKKEVVPHVQEALRRLGDSASGSPMLKVTSPALRESSPPKADATLALPVLSTTPLPAPALGESSRTRLACVSSRDTLPALPPPPVEVVAAEQGEDTPNKSPPAVQSPENGEAKNWCKTANGIKPARKGVGGFDGSVSLDDPMRARSGCELDPRPLADTMLAPEADGQEALDLLIAHVAFVDVPVMAFVRCAEAVDAGCESHAPVRYLFLLIGPESEMASSTAMAHALAGVMLDEQLVAGIAEATNPDDFLRVLDNHLEHVAILPHVHLPHTHHQAGHSSGNVSHGHGHSTSASESSHPSSDNPSAESDSDEDEVVLAEVCARHEAVA